MSDCMSGLLPVHLSVFVAYMLDCYVSACLKSVCMFCLLFTCLYVLPVIYLFVCVACYLLVCMCCLLFACLYVLPVIYLFVCSACYLLVCMCCLLFACLYVLPAICLLFPLQSFIGGINNNNKNQTHHCSNLAHVVNIVVIPIFSMPLQSLLQMTTLVWNCSEATPGPTITSTLTSWR